jgi:hypothetical protein|eukprot:COSAG06_NODE_2194_length_7378_cov_25.108119_7_plen_54_part_00
MSESHDEITGYILRKCKELVPSFDATAVIHAFAGACTRDFLCMPHAATFLDFA